MLRRPNLARAMLRSAAAGEPALASKVGLFHDKMRSMIVGALRGAPITADGEPISDRERLLGDVLNQIWFAVMVGWSGGAETETTINERMRESVDLVMNGAGGTV